MNDPLKNTPGQYDIVPAFDIGPEKIAEGWEGLAGWIAGRSLVVIDGYGGVLWDHVRSGINDALSATGQTVLWHDIEQALKPPEEINRLTAPFLGGDDPLWGTRFTGTLADFFDPEKLDSIRHDPSARLNILYGTGAALAGWNDAALIYIDVPKDEIQYRSRTGSIRNLGARTTNSPKSMYKQFYFVDWVALNRHKDTMLERIDAWVDGQQAGVPRWIGGDELRAALARMSRNVFRARPWFAPGPWGGQWMKEHFGQLRRDVPNYAWSFELIAPENGLMLRSGDRLLEVSFDTLMYHDHHAVLGNCADRFGTEFPIRFDYLDTFSGGNLSVQCHPRPEYIRENFGENFTQDETYYITDCAPGARVYLGFVGGIDPAEFRAALEHSALTGQEIDAEKFVNTEPSRKHGLYLIPNGTIHCSGRDNLVLEISATPYIFTFKMYDWVRRDLDGSMRPLNIARAFDNLYFDRTGERIAREFISTPAVIASGDDWRIVHLPTHPEHFYDVHRIEFSQKVLMHTGGDCHVLNLVQGTSVIVETSGVSMRINYAETFIIPAAAGEYRLRNEGDNAAMVVKAFVKKNPLK